MNIIPAVVGAVTPIVASTLKTMWKKRKFPWSRPRVSRKRLVTGIRAMRAKKRLNFSQGPYLTQTRSSSVWVPHHVSKKVELKEKNEIVTSISPSITVPYIYLANGIAVGTGANQRLGNRVELSRLTLRMQIKSGSSYLINTSRIMIVYDTQPNGLQVTTDELLHTPTDPILSLRDTTRPGRMEVLWDKTFVTRPVNGVWKSNDNSWLAQETERTFTVSINLGNRHPHYDDTGAIIDDINVGALYVIFWTDRAAGQAAGNYPVIDMNARLKYYDA